MSVHLRTVNRFVATSRPAGALRQARRVIAVANEDTSVASLLLEMALEAKRCVALVQHALVHRAVRRMATDATFPDRFVFEDEWSALRDVTLETGLVMAEQHGAPAFHGLRYIGATAFHSVTAMRVMAIGAAHFAFEDRMMMRQLESSPDFGVALETGRR